MSRSSGGLPGSVRRAGRLRMQRDHDSKRAPPSASPRRRCGPCASRRTPWRWPGRVRCRRPCARRCRRRPGENARRSPARSAGAHPGRSRPPRSRVRRGRCRSVQRTWPPSGTNLNALPSRFVTTRCSLSASAAAKHVSAPRSRSRCCVRRPVRRSAKRGGAAGRHVGVLRSIVSLPASSFDMSSRSLTCLSSMRALRAMTCAFSRRCARPSVVPSSATRLCAGPRISPSGVRSSRPTLANRCVLTSSSSRMRSSSPWSSTFFCATSRSCALAA